MNRIGFWTTAWLLTLSGCIGSGTNLHGHEPLVGHQDRTQAIGLSLDELNIRGEAVDGELQISVPIEITTQGAAEGKLEVAITEFDGTEVATNSSSFRLSESGAVTVSLPASAAGEPGAAEVARLVKATATVGTQTVVANRSLFYVMGKFDLRARIPNALSEGAASKIRVFAVDPIRNTPLVGVPVELDLKETTTEEVTSFTVKTLEDGSAVFDIPAQKGGTYEATVRAKDQGYVFAEIAKSLDVRRENKVLVTTDKPMYKPGQTMHIRALALKKPDLAAKADENTTVEVFDGKGNMVYRRYVTTNAFGIASATFKIANQVNIGNYRIAITVGETTSEKTVPVKPYALPKFKIQTALNAPYYLVGETIEGVVDARYFFGKAVDGGQVEVKAYTTDVEVVQIASASGDTDAKGQYSFALDLPDYLVGSALEGGNAGVVIEVTVTDTADNTESKAMTAVVAQQALNVVAIPESGKLVPGLENRVILFATDPLGSPLDATFTVSADETFYPVEVAGKGIGSFNVSADAENAFVVEAVTKSGVTLKTTVNLEVDAANSGLLVRTERAIYEVGESVTVQALTAGTSKIFFDVIKDGQTVLTKSVKVEDNVAAFVLDLDGSLTGDVLVEAYQVSQDASIQRDKKLIFVRDAKNLDIQIAADKPEYLPGEAAKLTFKVKDHDGKPAVAALGVQIVDEAVYALTEMKPGLLETYFQIQDELKKPKFQIKGASFNIPSLVTKPIGDTEVQTAAKAAFAALDITSAAGEISSWKGIDAQMKQVLKPLYQIHREKVEQTFAELAELGALDDDNAADQVENQTVFFDAWGNLYRFEVRENWSGIVATMRSFGPDEIADTADDWSANIVVVEFDQDPSEMFLAGGMEAQDAAAPNEDYDDKMPGPSGEGEEAPRVRKDFPETLYFNPSLITDGSGEAVVTLNMADSITEWRISTVANTAQGAVGSKTSGVTVFQDFFVDVSFPNVVTRHDEITFPVAIYNYLETPQTVKITLDAGDWFEALGGLSQTVELEAGQVTSVSFPVKLVKVGKHALKVTGIGSQMSDAVLRVVDVKPDGVRVDQSAAGMLEGTVTHNVSFPEGLVPDSQDMIVKIYPGIMAQAVEGLDSMLKEPHGCFEQTTASNWPNTLVLDYLNQTGQSSPELEMKAMNYLNQGYQRLLTFECTGGGFVWFGDPSPANVILSAMGVLEFSDMSRVMEIDQDVIKRTADWVIGDQKSDGHWTTNQGSEFATVQYDDTKTTAFVTWALAESPYGKDEVAKALNWLAPKATDADTDMYSLAMMGIAFATAEPDSARTTALLNRLADAAVTDDKGLVSWKYDGKSQYNSSSKTSIEVTALIVQAFVAASSNLNLVGGAVAYLASQKDGLGNYGSTHATILTLRAMIRSLANKTEEGEGTVQISVGGEIVETLAISEENRNVFQQFELGGLVDAASDTPVEITYEGTGKLMYQVVWSHHEPHVDPIDKPEESMAITVDYDKTSLTVNDMVTAQVEVTNLTDAKLDMVMLDLGVPPGFKVDTEKLQQAVDAGLILKYELPGQQVTIYLEKLAPGQSLKLSYDLQAQFPVKAQAPGASAYLYYQSTNRTDIAGATFTVTE